eukprot:TRINITY_DN3455_c0_g1_i2.p2 TRINITY_DN3455_c0_g1~~TRINITY_DN3455_c0_g1_i2.p2  ORF type:complete len:202 (-),score=-6.59 TRINITY_DN3455_c0_g1_i2:564-1130(-)
MEGVTNQSIRIIKLSTAVLLLLLLLQVRYYSIKQNKLSIHLFYISQYNLKFLKTAPNNHISLVPSDLLSKPKFINSYHTSLILLELMQLKNIKIKLACLYYSTQPTSQFLHLNIKIYIRKNVIYIFLCNIFGLTFLLLNIQIYSRKKMLAFSSLLSLNVTFQDLKIQKAVKIKQNFIGLYGEVQKQVK